MANPLDVSDALKYPGQIYPFSADIALPEVDVLGETVCFAPVHLEGTFLGAGEAVSIRAEFCCEARTRCMKCLADVRVPLQISLDERFEHAPDPEDPDLYAFEGSQIDLTECVKNALVLELPMRIVCSEDCKGLCPACGANRTLVPCTCLEGGAVANPFSALKAIVENEEEV